MYDFRTCDYLFVRLFDDNIVARILLHFVTNFLYFCPTSQINLKLNKNLIILTEQLAYGENDEYRYSLYRVKAQYAVYFDAITAAELKSDTGETIQSLAEYPGLSKTQIYYIARKVGRLPTREELDNRPKVGRPKKYN